MTWGDMAAIVVVVGGGGYGGGFGEGIKHLKDTAGFRNSPPNKNLTSGDRVITNENNRSDQHMWKIISNHL